MKSKAKEAAELEAELLRLTSLVRYRRAQLGRIAECPNKDCECRRVWRNHVERHLAQQVAKVRQQVQPKSAKNSRKKGR